MRDVLKQLHVSKMANGFEEINLGYVRPPGPGSGGSEMYDALEKTWRLSHPCLSNERSYPGRISPLQATEW